MKQLKLHRTLIRLAKTKDKSIEVLKTNDRMKLVEQVINKINTFLIIQLFCYSVNLNY